MFKVYFQLGLDHILDWNGADHMAFIVVMCSIYLFRDWRKVLIMVSAFTVGHSITLILGGLNLVKVNSELIERLIPLTIIATAIYYAFFSSRSKLNWRSYVLIALFGLIHGLGFSNYFSSLLGKTQNIVLPLLYFNLGVEVGQIIIVLILLAISTVLVKHLKVSHKHWSLFLAGIGFGMAVQILIG